MRAGRKKVQALGLRRGDREDRGRPREEEPRDEPDRAQDRRLPRDRSRHHRGLDARARTRCARYPSCLAAWARWDIRSSSPIEDRFILTKDELIGQIDVLLGGRAAEEIAFGLISTGAANDLTRATDIARRMITDYGMSERFRHVALTRRGSVMLGNPTEPFMAREYSEETQNYVDEEIARILAERYDSVLASLRGKKSLLDAIAERLLEKETLDEAEFSQMMHGQSD